MAQTAKKGAKELSSKETQQKRLIKNLQKKENWMKWGLLGLLIIILLLLLFIGYATDWTRGFKTTSSTPLSTNLDAARSSTSTPTTSNGTGSSGSSGSSGTSGSTGSSGTTGSTGATGAAGSSGTNGTNGTNGGGGGSTTTNNTTTNNSTTTNNTTTPAQNPTNAFDALQSIYRDTAVGSNLTEIVNRALAAGINVDCTDTLLLRTCNLSAGGKQIVLRGLVSTGLVTSILQL